MSFPIVRHWELIAPNRYAYLWMMYVVDADLSEHCQKSLIGVKSRKFSKGAKHGYADQAPIELNEAESPFYYICGGSPDYDWNKNLHIAFRYKKDHVIKIKTPREHWIIDHAERIEISADDIDRNDPHYSDLNYRTCRCWRHGHFVKKHLEKMPTVQRLL